MKDVIFTIILPPLTGFFAVIGILLYINILFHNSDSFIKPDNEFFTLAVPVSLIFAIIIQFTIALPLWKKFMFRKKIWNLSLFQFTGLVCVMSGLIFGFMFWENDLGIYELFALFVTGSAASAVYWCMNIYSLNLLSR